MTMKPVDAIHGKSIDDACEDDRRWFEANSDRNYRLRDATKFEMNGPLPPARPGLSWRILVAQIKEGMRIRQLIALPDHATNESACDADLAQIFEDIAPPQIVEQIRRAAEKV